jgi:hypothetical protein
MDWHHACLHWFCEIEVNAMATIHVPTTGTLLRSLAMLAAARRTSIRAEVNEACRLHVERQRHVVLSAAEKIAEPVDAEESCGAKSDCASGD